MSGRCEEMAALGRHDDTAEGRGTLPPPSEKAASFFHQYRDVVLVEVGAEGLPVA